ncbi:MAG: hypothetical protein LBI79_10540 [Nitrososphaerota archaeon]|jgi:hypothetical protein|nr:hypothetical protein [Nitrososphaerota archaeon]
MQSIIVRHYPTQQPTPPKRRKSPTPLSKSSCEHKYVLDLKSFVCTRTQCREHTLHTCRYNRCEIKTYIPEKKLHNLPWNIVCHKPYDQAYVYACDYKSVNIPRFKDSFWFYDFLTSVRFTVEADRWYSEVCYLYEYSTSRGCVVRRLRLCKRQRMAVES